MSIRYARTPQVHYGNGQGSNPWARFPQGAQPIASAPQRTAQPIIVYEPNGTGHWALHHGNGWKKLSPFRNSKDGSVQWRMDGRQISNAVAWALPRKK
jgi:hypothetical protein